MYYKIFFVSALLIIETVNHAFSQKGNITSEKIKLIDSLISNTYSDSLPGISILIAKDGVPVHKKAIGMADMALNVKLSPDHVFGIGSQTKQFTAIGILKLVEQGKLSLKDDILKYLPNYNTRGQTITIENLLTHTSGIASYTELPKFEEIYRDDKSVSEIISFFKDSSLLFIPSSKWSYTNSGYLLLAAIIEKVTGGTYRHFIEENLFKPAGMQHTYWGSNSSIIPGLANQYESIDAVHMQNAGYFSWSWALGAGDIISCTGDMLNWMNALTSGKIISNHLFQKAWTPYKLSDGRSINYGYGWSVSSVNGNKLVAHGGAIGGYLSDAIFIPEQNVYIAALSNYNGYSPANLTKKIALILLDLPFKIPEAIEIGADELKEFTGVFELNMKGSRIVENLGREKEYHYITAENGKLFIQSSGDVKSELIGFNADQFYSKHLDKYISFSRDKKKQVTQMELSSYPVQYGPVDVCVKTAMPLKQPQQEVQLSPEVLKFYCGTYELKPGFNLMIFQTSNQLFLQATGQGAIELFCETETHFFMKELDAQVDFVKNEEGKISSLTLTQGQKFHCIKISDKTAVSERKEITVDQKLLQSYCGAYQLQPGFDLTVFLKDNQFLLQATGQSANELFAESETRFFLKVVDAQVEFVKDTEGQISKLILYQGGRKECTRIK